MKGQHSREMNFSASRIHMRVMVKCLSVSHNLTSCCSSALSLPASTCIEPVMGVSGRCGGSRESDQNWPSMVTLRPSQPSSPPSFLSPLLCWQRGRSREKYAPENRHVISRGRQPSGRPRESNHHRHKSYAVSDDQSEFLTFMLISSARTGMA